MRLTVLAALAALLPTCAGGAVPEFETDTDASPPGVGSLGSGPPPGGNRPSAPSDGDGDRFFDDDDQDPADDDLDPADDNLDPTDDDDLNATEPGADATDPDAGLCCDDLGDPGCGHAGVESCVCAHDPYCCSDAWDLACAVKAVLHGCAECPGIGGGMGSCCDSNASVGCLDASVQACVCAVDIACCTEAWDEICVQQVSMLGCGSC